MGLFLKIISIFVEISACTHICVLFCKSLSFVRAVFTVLFIVMPVFTNPNIPVTEGLFVLFYKYELIVLNNRLHFPISYELKHCHDLRDTVYDI